MYSIKSVFRFVDFSGVNAETMAVVIYRLIYHVNGPATNSKWFDSPGDENESMSLIDPYLISTLFDLWSMAFLTGQSNSVIIRY